MWNGCQLQNSLKASFTWWKRNQMPLECSVVPNPLSIFTVRFGNNNIIKQQFQLIVNLLRGEHGILNILFHFILTTNQMGRPRLSEANFALASSSQDQNTSPWFMVLIIYIVLHLIILVLSASHSLEGVRLRTLQLLPQYDFFIQLRAP